MIVFRRKYLSPSCSSETKCEPNLIRSILSNLCYKFYDLIPTRINAKFFKNFQIIIHYSKATGTSNYLYIRRTKAKYNYQFAITSRKTYFNLLNSFFFSHIAEI